ncbi:MAG: hypothetical protein RL430_1661 [Actinomycetota bacterium]|jgi:hypothetical protein
MLAIVVAKEQREVSFGDLFSDLSKLHLDNEGLLAHVDDIILESKIEIDALPDPVSLVIARLLVSAIAAESELLERESDRSVSLGACEFFALTEENANWAGLSDSAVLDRLLRISDGHGAGLTSRAMPEAIEKEIVKLRKAWNAS